MTIRWWKDSPATRSGLHRVPQPKLPYCPVDGLRNHRTLQQIFALPIVIGILSTVGLLAALIGDGWWDGLSWATLSLPILLYVLFSMRRPAKPRH
jgi:hypothetical protein